MIYMPKELTVWNNHDAYKVGNTHLCFTEENNSSQYVVPIDIIKIHTLLKDNKTPVSHYINEKRISAETYRQIMDILRNEE